MKGLVTGAIVLFTGVMLWRALAPVPKDGDALPSAEIKILQEGRELGSEAKVVDGAVRIEVEAPLHGTAFLAFFDGAGKLTVKPQDLFEARQPTEARTSAVFENVEIPATSELLVVFTCPMSEVDLVGGVLSNFAELEDIREALPSCRFSGRDL